MSIINNAQPGSSYSLMFMIDSVLSTKPRKIEQLEAMCRPENLPDNLNAAGKFRETIKFWCEEGLWVLRDGTEYALPEDQESISIEKRLLTLCNARVGHDSASMLSDKRVAPFVSLISMFLALDSYTFSGGQRLISAEIEPAVKANTNIRINSSNESTPFLNLAECLGFIEPLNKVEFVVDPTRAIECYLPDIFSEETELPVSDFIEKLSNYLPMLDGGDFRNVLEEEMEKKNWVKPESHHISASLSHAIMRLRSNLVLATTPLSDDINYRVLKSGGKGESISKVKYIGGY